MVVSFVECFTCDSRNLESKPSAITSIKLSLTNSSLLAVILMRVSQYLWHRKIIWRLAPFIKRLNEILTGFECHLEAVIGKGLFLPHTQNLVIGAGVTIGNNVTIYNGVTLGALKLKSGDDNAQRYPIIHDNVVIYTGAKVIGPITIGSNSIIGANSVVLSDVPDYHVAVGIPAKIIDPHKRASQQE